MSQGGRKYQAQQACTETDSCSHPEVEDEFRAVGIPRTMKKVPVDSRIRHNLGTHPQNAAELAAFDTHFVKGSRGIDVLPIAACNLKPIATYSRPGIRADLSSYSGPLSRSLRMTLDFGASQGMSTLLHGPPERPASLTPDKDETGSERFLQRRAPRCHFVALRTRPRAGRGFRS